MACDSAFLLRSSPFPQVFSPRNRDLRVKWRKRRRMLMTRLKIHLDVTKRNWGRFIPFWKLNGNKNVPLVNINQETKWISPNEKRNRNEWKNCAPPTTTQPFVWNSGLKLGWRYSQSSNNYVIIFLEKDIARRLRFVLAWSRCLKWSESYSHCSLAFDNDGY